MEVEHNVVQVTQIISIIHTAFVYDQDREADSVKRWHPSKNNNAWYHIKEDQEFNSKRREKRVGTYQKTTMHDITSKKTRNLIVSDVKSALAPIKKQQCMISRQRRPGI